MKFWDASAITPLVVSDVATKQMQATYIEDPVMSVWWATEIECASAITRLEREGSMTTRATQAAFERLDGLSEEWTEVQANEPVRRTARRLLRTHDLRAGEALQLAAAVAACEGDPSTLPIVSLDDRLSAAARREGFTVIEG